MAGLSKKDRAIVLKSLEEQGARLEETKDGTRILFPDGGTHMIHRSESDSKSLLANRAVIRRHGFTWPFEARTPKKDRSMNAQRRSHAEIRQLILMRLDELQLVAPLHELTINPTAISDEIGVQLSVVNKHLRELGWEMEKPGHWTKRDLAQRAFTAIVGTPAEETKVREVTFAPSVLDAMAEQDKQEAKREFLDTVDSWEVKLTTSIAESTVGELFKHFRAAGLHMEIRVWRDGEEN